MSGARAALAVLGLSLVVTLGGLLLPIYVPVAVAAPLDAQPAGIPNPFQGLFEALTPEKLGKLLQDTATFLLRQLVGGLHGLLLGLTQGDDNVITRTPPSMTYQSAFVIERHNALAAAMDWGLVAALAVVGILVILGPNSPLSFPVAGEVVPRLVIAYIVGHSSLQWGGWFIDLSNALCAAVAPADPFPLGDSVDVETAFIMLALALIYGLMALLLALFMHARAQLIAVLLILAPAAAVCWVLPGRPRQWAELWIDLFFSNLFVQFIQVLVLHLGVDLLRTAHSDNGVMGLAQFVGGLAALLLVFRVPSLVAAGVGGGATSFLGMVAVMRGVHFLGVPRLSQHVAQMVVQARTDTWNVARQPRATMARIANSPASSVAGRVITDTVVR